jgi:aspartyl-tRNA(Asn)/glutamyl-tRNA(Gln) amidotransferase subunit B
LPGALPVPNALAIELLVRAGLAFGCEIPSFSKFDRKNYFYPDMPKDYQISQYDVPLCQGGSVSYWLFDGLEKPIQKTVQLTRIHLEEDTAKSIHAGSSDGRLAGSTHSLVDFNRAGVPLMECVSEPDIANAIEAVGYLEALKRTFVALGVSDVKMEEGSLRCDANVSIRPVGATEFGTKAEIKNLNSFRSVARAIDSEIARQAAILESGGRVIQETRGWDEVSGTTHSQRSKEQAHDYRYFPDPDLVPIAFDEARVRRMRDELGPLPQARLDRFILRDGISAVQAHQLVDTPGLADYFEATLVILGGEPTFAADDDVARKIVNFVLGDLSRLANESGTRVDASGMTPDALAELVALVEGGGITSKTAKELMERVFADGGSPRAIVDAEGLAQVNDTDAIDDLVRRVLAEQEKTVAEYRAGKTKVLGFLQGQAMKASAGKANPEIVRERLLALLGA